MGDYAGGAFAVGYVLFLAVVGAIGWLIERIERKKWKGWAKRMCE